MPEYILRPRAEDDLIEISAYFADHREGAETLMASFISTFQQLANLPRLGRRRPEFGPKIHSFTVRKYVVLYTPIRNGVQIERILHGARNLREAFLRNR